MSQTFNNNRRTRIRRAALLVVIAISAATSANAVGQNAERIWVDSAGNHSVKASLVDWTDNSVVLLRSDGGEVRLQMSALSEKDKDYVATQKERRFGQNSLRNVSPSPPDIKSLAPLELPVAEQTLPSGAILGADGATKIREVDSLPEKLPADRAPTTVAIADANIALPRVDFNMVVSSVVPITGLSESGTRTTALAASISGNIRMPGESTRQELVRFDLTDRRAEVAMRHYETIRLLDHHLESGRSLVLVGFNSLGRGGELAVIDSWDDGAMGFNYRRRISASDLPGELAKLQFAKWIDAEHVLAVVDDSMGLWNIVSGKQLYRINGIDPRATPAISGGGRYTAIPYEGGVDLIETESGKSLGRIKVEKQVPGVAFSPLGNQLAIATTRRLRAWDLTSAALAGDIQSRNSLGKGQPLWIDHDLLLTDSGTLVSLFRGVPIWRYEVAGTQRSTIGKTVAIFRKEPVTEMTLVTLPHEGAEAMLKRIDAVPSMINPESWQIPGRSAWQSGKWVDQDVLVGSLTSGRR